MGVFKLDYIDILAKWSGNGVAVGWKSKLASRRYALFSGNIDKSVEKTEINEKFEKVTGKQ